MIVSDYIPIRFKNELSKILKLSNSLINYLIDGGEITIKTNGKKILVSNSSLKKFQSKFNRDNYYSKRETIQMIRDKGFYSEYIKVINTYDTSNIGFPHTYQQFKKNGKFKIYTIDKTDFVEKNSLHSLIDTLSKIEKDKPKVELGERISKTTLKKPKVKLKNTTKETKWKLLT